MTTLIKSAYNQERSDNKLFCLDANGDHQESRTKQSHKDECDINLIIKKHDKHGILTHVNKAIAMYGDFTEVNEYQDAINLISVSNTNFAAIPSEIRRKFDNNAGEFLEFASNPDNLEEMCTLGLAVKPAPIIENIQKVEVITPTPSPETETITSE